MTTPTGALRAFNLCSHLPDDTFGIYRCTRFCHVSQIATALNSISGSCKKSSTNALAATQQRQSAVIEPDVLQAMSRMFGNHCSRTFRLFQTMGNSLLALRICASVWSDPPFCIRDSWKLWPV